MPKTTVNEDNLSSAREYEIGLSWKVLTVKSVSKTQAMNKTANKHFRRSILTSDERHPFASFLPG